MSLTAQERSRVWWGGFFKGAIQALPIGVAVAIGAALLLGFVAIPLMPSLAPVFGGFLSWGGLASSSLSFLAPYLPSVGVASAAGAITATAPFFPLPIIIFNTALSIAGNAYAAATSAVGDMEQKVDHAANKYRINELEGRMQTVERDVGQRPRTIDTILLRGSRAQQSFVAAEEARAVQAAKETLLH